MFDYSYFALMFALATALAPEGARTVVLENTAHPEQRMLWVRGEGDRWAGTINGRELGHFRREQGAVIHETGQRAPDRFELASLADARDLHCDALRVRLLGRWSGSVVTVTEEPGSRLLRDASGRALAVPLRLRVGTGSFACGTASRP